MVMREGKEELALEYFEVVEEIFRNPPNFTGELRELFRICNDSVKKSNELLKKLHNKEKIEVDHLDSLVSMARDHNSLSGEYLSKRDSVLHSGNSYGVEEERLRQIQYQDQFFVLGVEEYAFFYLELVELPHAYNLDTFSFLKEWKEKFPNPKDPECIKTCLWGGGEEFG